MVSDKYKFIFVHITKTGGCSVMKALGVHENRDHRPALTLKRMIPKKWEEYYKFSFVRNPWERLVSVYFYCKKRNETIIKSLRQHGKQFQTWAPIILGRRKPEYYLASQLSRITDKQGNIMVDFIGRNEYFARDIAIIQEKLNRPLAPPQYVNVSSHKHYSAYYTPTLIKLVEEVYKEDIEYFNYKYEQRVSAETYKELKFL